MKTRIKVAVLVLCILGLAAVPAAAFGGNDRGLMRRATADGKYSELLRTIRVPGDRNAYGDFNDYGYWDGTDWAGYTDLPPGYWVNVAPNWYIWGCQRAETDAAARQASVDGKYAHLLRTICVPGDQATYGDFNDYGYWEGTAWAGYADLPPGYWVYVAPNWYIWSKQR